MQVSINQEEIGKIVVFLWFLTVEYFVYCLQAIYILDDKNYKLKHRISIGSLKGISFIKLAFWIILINYN